ncbi:hypothetical protein V2G26_016173 [Clonostachys chloroleuca]
MLYRRLCCKTSSSWPRLLGPRPLTPNARAPSAWLFEPKVRWASFSSLCLLSASFWSLVGQLTYLEAVESWHPPYTPVYHKEHRHLRTTPTHTDSTISVYTTFDEILRLFAYI